MTRIKALIKCLVASARLPTNTRTFMKANLPILLLVLAISVTSCSDNNVAEKPKDGQWPSIEAIYSKKPVKVDGLLDEEIWSQAKVYSLAVAKNLQSSRPLAEAGSVQFAWDDEYFYLAAKFKDSDIVAEGKEDQLHQSRISQVTGDKRTGF